MAAATAVEARAASSTSVARAMGDRPNNSEPVPSGIRVVPFGLKRLWSLPGCRLHYLSVAVVIASGVVAFLNYSWIVFALGLVGIALGFGGHARMKRHFQEPEPQEHRF